MFGTESTTELTQVQITYACPHTHIYINKQIKNIPVFNCVTPDSVSLTSFANNTYTYNTHIHCQLTSRGMRVTRSANTLDPMSLTLESWSLIVPSTGMSSSTTYTSPRSPTLSNTQLKASIAPCRWGREGETPSHGNTSEMIC